MQSERKSRLRILPVTTLTLGRESLVSLRTVPLAVANGFPVMIQPLRSCASYNRGRLYICIRSQSYPLESGSDPSKPYLRGGCTSLPRPPRFSYKGRVLRRRLAAQSYPQKPISIKDRLNCRITVSKPDSQVDYGRRTRY